MVKNMFINVDSENKKLKNSILALSAEAIAMKKKDNTTINATAGTMKNEDGSLYEFSCVEKVLKSLNVNQKFAYSDSSGSPAYNKAVIKTVFGKYIDEIRKTCYVESIPTPGGTGALNLAFNNYVGRGETVLLPNHMWENYLNCAKEMDFVPQTYLLFDEEGNFNDKDIDKQVNIIKQKQNRIMILVNDPCENPTGFCMTDDDYDRLIDISKNHPETKFIYLMDIAYFDFYNTDPDLVRSRFAKFKDMPDNALTLFTFSGSKSFGLYGLRIGSLIIMSKQEKEITMFLDANNFSCRVIWSSCSTLGMSLIENLVLNEDYNYLYEEEIKSVCSLLESRSIAFLKAAKEVGLKTLPYKRGFFICVPVDNPDEIRKKLHEDKVHLISTKCCLRIALCAINKDEAARLPAIIKNRLNNL